VTLNENVTLVAIYSQSGPCPAPVPAAPAAISQPPLEAMPGVREKLG
jgi:hypothetical protein